MLTGDTKRLKNIQASARRRGFSVCKDGDEGELVMTGRQSVLRFQDMNELLDELRNYETT